MTTSRRFSRNTVIRFMRYEITGGIEKGIHYTRIVEKAEDEDEGMNSKEGAVKSYGKTEIEKLDTEQSVL